MSARYGVVCFLALALAGGSVAQEKDGGSPVSMTPLSAEQFEVYRAVLAGAKDEHMPQVNLAARTTVLDPEQFVKDGCGKGLELEPESSLVHDFQSTDVTRFGKVKTRLVSPEQGRKDVDKNDPGRAIRSGVPIENALENGYAHGLFTLSEIRFDKDHKHAIVAYSFMCGGLCGHGATLILEKTGKGWKSTGQCSIWMS